MHDKSTPCNYYPEPKDLIIGPFGPLGKASEAPASRTPLRTPKTRQANACGNHTEARKSVRYPRQELDPYRYPDFRHSDKAITALMIALYRQTDCKARPIPSI